jgi:type I restriction enzyme S subunit
MRHEIITETECQITEQAVKSSATNIIPKGNVVIATRVGLGKVCILGQDTAINQDLRGIVPNNIKVVGVRFLFWWLKTIAHLIEKEGTGATVKGVKLPFVKSLQVPVPPFPEQQRIVGILDEAFDAIATAKANAEKNLQNARALLESALNAAITGKLTQDWRRAHPNTESASEHVRKKLTQRRSNWKGKGKYKEPDPPVANKPVDIPKIWTLVSPEQISTHIVDCPHSTPKWTNSGVVCLRTTNFKPGFLDLQSVQFVSEETYKQRVLRLEPKPGDVLYSREGGILGIACIIPKNFTMCLGQRMMQFRLDASMALPEYFTGVLNSALILSEVRRLTGGAASPHLNIRDIRTFPIPLPPIAEQRQIIAKLTAISAETQRLESIYQQKLAALEALKKSLLHQAFSGQL